ncbi:MAG: transposase domain-containing protein [Rhodoferax sp.]|nr:transposase domain-containing protein [Rhodoferax sp.]
MVHHAKQGRNGQHARDFLQHAPPVRALDQNANAAPPVRRWAVGKNWLFSGSLAAGARAADIMSLIQTAKINGIEPLTYLTDVLTRLPTHPNSYALLPDRPAWQHLLCDSCPQTSDLRSTLPSHTWSPSCGCDSLRSLRSACGRTCTSRSLKDQVLKAVSTSSSIFLASPNSMRLLSL